MKGGGKMADAQQINDFLVDAFGRINKIEERAMTTGLGSAISITEIHIIEKIGLSEPARMSASARFCAWISAVFRRRAPRAPERAPGFVDGRR